MTKDFCNTLSSTSLTMMVTRRQGTVFVRRTVACFVALSPSYLPWDGGVPVTDTPALAFLDCSIRASTIARFSGGTF